MPDTWSGTIARLGVPTGDGRILAPAGTSHRALPLPLSWQRSSADGHLSSVVVGRIDAIDIDTMACEVRARGVLLDEATTPEVAEVRSLLEHGVTGPSVDPGAVEYEVIGGGWDEYDRPMPEMVLFTRYEIAGVTLVSVPAFPGLGIKLGEPEQVAASLVAAVRSEGWCDLPVADRDHGWDGDAAAARVAAWAGVDAEDAGEGAWARYGQGFLYRDDDADSMTRGAYKMGIADVIDGTLTLVPAGVFAAASVLGGGRGGVDAPAEEQERMRQVLSGVYECADLGTPPWDDEDMAASVTACATALPPATWYDDPHLDGPTPITITTGGRVYGHIADWSTCHVGLPGCVTPPPSMANYAYFTTGSALTADGTEVPVGKLTVGTGHADAAAGFQAAAEHYDHTGTVVATVAAGEDAYGIWVAGAIVPEATVEQVEALRRSPISGDWRRIGGNLELVAALAVNVPGFPVPRARAMVAAGGEQLSLVASARTAGTLAEPDATTAVTVPDGRDGARRRARAKLRIAGMR